MPPPIKRILLAEDDTMLAGLLIDRFNMEGWDVTHVEDGQAACDIMEQDFDVMILDLLMPVKDGFEVLKEAKKKHLSYPIIVASNLSQPEELERTTELGAAAAILKSNIDLDGFVKAVREVHNTYVPNI
ncbi:hypothetical protein COV06_00430 [Candidatus Uhrbacteria bacterium CG10_big_fil_rev_8_21_14_0_10_50_16]|uniref:Response regulatory domain-containing protein n=1 Tax=Candidatus Uhrbacteria bacterium CG10_big_fil_rev_8_21_14_0_10_50_16 TaxID=1975039 RepID=A0A2H0RQ25_9BACT|nr:MAG: hypothetical protein COV06_00430 [Candidatus Uhrbacteria bacterium CG10_big_fil_rev_8_21_14_0_10_50_16]